jgi:hypothetical protein
MEQVQVTPKLTDARNDDDYIIFIDDDAHYFVPLMNAFADIFGHSLRLLHYHQAADAWDCIMRNLVFNGKLPRLVVSEAFISNPPHEPVFLPGALMKAYPEIPIVLFTHHNVENIVELNKRSNHFAAVVAKQHAKNDYAKFISNIINTLL